MRRRSATLTTKQPTNVERRPSRLNAAKVVGMLTCPSCGSDSFARMSHTWCLHFHECKHCGSMITPRRGECCVFRSYGVSAICLCDPLDHGQLRRRH